MTTARKLSDSLYQVGEAQLAQPTVTRVQDVALGRSDGSPGQRFYLDHAPVVTRTADEHIVIRMEDGREDHWQEVSDFANSTASDRHYTIDSDTGEVRLGPRITTTGRPSTAIWANPA